MAENDKNSPIYFYSPRGATTENTQDRSVVDIVQGMGNNVPDVTSPMDVLTGNSHVSNVVNALLPPVFGVANDSVTVATSLVLSRDVNTYVATGGALGSVGGLVLGGAIVAGRLTGFASVLVESGTALAGTYLGQSAGYDQYIQNNAPRSMRLLISHPPTSPKLEPPIGYCMLSMPMDSPSRLYTPKMLLRG